MISGNGYDGVQIVNGANFNVVAGNKIGTDVSGTAALGNSSSGVEVDAGCANNTIGGLTTGAGVFHGFDFTSATSPAALTLQSDLSGPPEGQTSGGPTAVYRIDLEMDGMLLAIVHPQGLTARLMLLDSQGRVLVQGDGLSPSDPDSVIDQDLAAGNYSLVVESTGGAGTYTLTTLTQATVPFQLLPVGYQPDTIVAGDFTGDGRTDLAVVNQGTYPNYYGSVSVLLGNGDGTFQPPVTYAVGLYPSAIVAGDFTGDGRTDLAVANSGSNDVSILLGNGNGTFQPQITYVVGNGPGPLFVGSFDGKPDLVTVNAGSNDLTLISDFLGLDPVTTTISSGGLDPVAAFEFSSGSGFDNLVVANNGDGTFALLEGGPHGLNLTSTETEPGLHPTDLTFLAFTGGQVQFYAATEGSEAATLLTFQLGGETGGMSTVPGLQPLRDAALPLIGSLLTLTIETSTVEFDLSATNGEAAAAVSFLPVSTVTMGQSLPEHASTGESANSDQEEPNKPQEPDLPVTRESSSWQPFLMGLDEALDQFCRDSLDQFMSRDEPASDKAQLPHALSKPLNLWQRDQASPQARGTIGTDSNHLPEANQGPIIDEAIHSLWADESRPVRTSLTPTSVPLTSDGTAPAETAPVDATLLSTEPVQRQDGSLLSSYERGFEALTECAVSLFLAAFVARRIDPPSTRQCTRRRLEGLYRSVH